MDREEKEGGGVMIDVRFILSRLDDGMFVTVGLRCTGHAEYREEGEDIVCASASTLTHALEIGVRDVLKIPCTVRSNAKVPIFEILWDKNDAMDASVPMEMIRGAFEDLQRSYPDCVEVWTDIDNLKKGGRHE